MDIDIQINEQLIAVLISQIWQDTNLPVFHMVQLTYLLENGLEARA